MLKKLFGLKSRGNAAQASRKALIALDAEIADARGKVTFAEEWIGRLRSVAGEEATAARDLQEAIAQDKGTALELYATGHATPITGLVTAADAAAKAAVAARAGLPAAERALADAKSAVAELESKKRGLVTAALIEHGNVIAARYRAAFIELGVLHDEMLAFAQGIAAAGHADITMVATVAIEAPKFKLPAMQPPPKEFTTKAFSRHGLASDTGGYTPYLRYQVDSHKVRETASLWTSFANQLATDPAADITALPPTAAPIAGRMIKQRERREPSLIEAGIMPGSGNGKWLGA